MSRNLDDLCLLLVEETHGTLASRIYRSLLGHGRCSLAIIRSSTGLTLPQIRQGLVNLVQHNLVDWFTDDKGTAFECNKTAAYNIARNGKYIETIEARFGTSAGRVVNYLLRTGHAPIMGILEACQAPHNEELQVKEGAYAVQVNGITKRASKENGRIARCMITDSEGAYDALCNLLKSGIIRKSHKSFFRTTEDLQTEAENSTMSVDLYKGPNKKVLVEQWERDIGHKLDMWAYGTHAEREEISGLVSGKKRPLEHSEGQYDHKRVKLNDSTGIANGAHELESEETSLLEEGKLKVGSKPASLLMKADHLKPDIVLSVNHAKIAVLHRNSHLVEVVEKAVCAATAGVYKEVLNQIEPNLMTCQVQKVESLDKEDERGGIDVYTVLTGRITTSVPESDDLRNALADAADDDIEDEVPEHRKKRRRRNGPEASTESDEDSNDEESGTSEDEDEEMADAELSAPRSGVRSIAQSPHEAAVRSHLLLLAQHPFGFLKRKSKRSGERWRVDFPGLIKRLQNQEIMNIIASRHGRKHMRLANIVADKGNLDEKTLSSLSLTKEKELRLCLLTVWKAGMLEVQDVPRDNGRQASRTTFLYSFKHEKCVQKLTEESFKTMGRLLERARVEKERVQVTLEKASRSDVIGREDELLNKSERDALDEWKEVEEMLWGQVARIDETVALFRDF